MKTFDEIYKDTYEDPTKWDYYKCFAIPLIPFDEIMGNRATAISFIEEYIFCSGKSDTELVNNIKELDDVRAKHIVSTFFLGIYLYHYSNIIKCAIDKVIKKFQQKGIREQEKIEEMFSYLWFLICLFHDLGYLYENKKEPEESYDSFIENKCEGKGLNPVDGVPKYYEKIVKEYFNYRLKRFNRHDHGICGAYKFFHDLCRILKKGINNDLGTVDKSIMRNLNLYFGPELKNLYNYAAWIILAHNIWYVKKDSEDAECYKQYGLNELILNRVKYKIRLNKHPFLFLFCLVDTIEPVKCIEPIKRIEKELLSQVSLEIDEKKITLESHWGNWLTEEDEKNEWIRKAKDVNNWLTQAKQTGNSVTITITK